MTDKEIIKALDCCPKGNLCEQCPLGGTNDCMTKLYINALDLINRKQAEIEELRIENQSLRAAASSYKIHYDEARTETVKELSVEERLPDYKYIPEVH